MTWRYFLGNLCGLAAAIGILFLLESAGWRPPVWGCMLLGLGGSVAGGILASWRP